LYKPYFIDGIVKVKVVLEAELADTYTLSPINNFALLGSVGKLVPFI